VLDLDGLKVANDRHGHDVGDVLIRSLGEVLEAAVREHDVVARIGGDEFAILLPASRDHDCARTVARITAAITRRQVDAMPLSASIGWATCPPAVSLGEALTLADARMYEAKRTRKSTAAAR
jgi:diguanylate cyclase (GGDEF)-like protein